MMHWLLRGAWVVLLIMVGWLSLIDFHLCVMALTVFLPLATGGYVYWLKQCSQASPAEQRNRALSLVAQTCSFLLLVTLPQLLARAHRLPAYAPGIGLFAWVILSLIAVGWLIVARRRW
jgi:hypothetical protein